MNSAQRRQKLRPIKKEWPDGARVLIKAGYAKGIQATVTNVALGWRPLTVLLDTGVAIHNTVVYELKYAFEDVTKL